jgi:hypothetical protein
MNYIASFYPLLSERRPIPLFYLPTTFLLTLVPFFLPNRRIGVLATFPLLLALCFRAPFYTFGSPSGDYYNSGPFLAILLWYLDFVILSPAEGPNAPTFIGASSSAAGSADGAGPGWTGLRSWSQKLGWAFRLMIPSHRGIGWNWQVKGVPSDHRAKLSKWQYVKSHLQRTALTYLRSMLMLVVMGCSSTLLKEGHPSRPLMVRGLDAAIGWSGAIWVWDRLNCFYSLVAALSVACGLCDTWEWPPLTGQLRDAWSVRQMWRFAAPSKNILASSS